MHLLFSCEKNAKPTAAPLLSQAVFELHLRVEFKTFIKLAEAQKENVEKLIDLAPDIDDPKKSIEHGIEMIKLNKLKKDTELWIGGGEFGVSG